MGGIRPAPAPPTADPAAAAATVVVTVEVGRSEPRPSQAKNGGGASALYDGLPATVSGNSGGMGSTSTAGLPGDDWVSHMRENGGTAFVMC